MITHEEMAAAFGNGGLLVMDVEQAHEQGFSEEDAHILCQVGLPVRADQVFTTRVTDEPSVGVPMTFQTSGGDVNVVTLGGTSQEAGMRYFLDLHSGTVGLLSFDDEPQAEQVNSSLATFIEFLYRLRIRQQKLTDGAGGGSDYTEQLWASLSELDPAAFNEGEAWWHMVMDALMKRDHITETREFLAQRRAETDTD